MVARVAGAAVPAVLGPARPAQEGERDPAPCLHAALQSAAPAHCLRFPESSHDGSLEQSLASIRNPRRYDLEGHVTA